MADSLSCQLVSAAKHGLKVERYADWTAHVRGFWSVGLFELAKLWAEEKEGGTFAQHMHVIKKVRGPSWVPTSSLSP